jgi:hypothetical protein
MPNVTCVEVVSETSRYQWDGGRVILEEEIRACGAAVIFTQPWWFSASGKKELCETSAEA